MKYYLLENHKKQYHNTLTTKAKQRNANRLDSFMFYSNNIAGYKSKFLCHGAVFHK